MKNIQMTILMAMIAAICACSNKNQNHDHSEHEMQSSEDHSHHHEAMKSMEVSGTSVFNLESNWVTEESDTIMLKDLKGGIKVMSMVYTHCQSACPRIVADMKMIEERLLQKGVDDVQFVLVSLDPKRDKPKRLNYFANENNFDKAHWTLLTGSEENIQELAVVLGVKYKAISETDFSHSNLITVLSPGGEIIYRQEGLGTQPDQTIKAIEEAI